MLEDEGLAHCADIATEADPPFTDILKPSPIGRILSDGFDIVRCATPVDEKDRFQILRTENCPVFLARLSEGTRGDVVRVQREVGLRDSAPAPLKIEHNLTR
jgi:hypothetical protein